MFTVYRIEDKNGIGPYTGYSSVTSMLHQNHTDEDHPGICKDLKGIIDYKDQNSLYCACATREKLTKWFWGYITKLRKDDFRIVEIKVSKVVIGHSKIQVFFDPKNIISKTYLN